MRPRLRRAAWLLAASGGAMALLLALLLAALWTAGNTDSGRRLIERATYRLTVGHVSLSGLGGSFPAHLTLAQLKLSDARGVWLTADGLTVDWSVMALLRRAIHVEGLHAVRVSMERTPDGGQGGGSPYVPHVEVGSFVLEDVELGAALVGTPAALTASGRFELRSLENADTELIAHRRDGVGDYHLKVRLDAARLEAALSVHEPAHGPLEHLLSVPGLGALDARATVSGPRAAVLLDVTVDAGELKGRVHGSLDLVKRAAELDYSLDSAALAPRADLSWDRLALSGNWHGSLTDLEARGDLEVVNLRIPGATHMARLRAELTGDHGKLGLHSTLDGLEIPGPQPRLLTADALLIDAVLLPGQDTRPLELHATHPSFSAVLRADTAVRAGSPQRATLQLDLPEVQPFAALAGQDARGSAKLNVQVTRSPQEQTLLLDVDLGLTGGSAPWVAAVGSHATATLSASLAGQSLTVQSLRVASPAATLAASGSASRVPDAPTFMGSWSDLQLRWQFDVADLSHLSGDAAGDLHASGRISGALAALALDAQAASHLAVRGSPSGDVQAEVHARGLPGAPEGTVKAHGMVDAAPLDLDASLERGAAGRFRVRVRQADWKSIHIDGDMTADAALASSSGRLRLSVARLADFDRLLGVSIGGSVEGTLAFLPANGSSEAHLVLNGKSLSAGPVAGDLHLEAAGAADALGVKLDATLPAFYGMPAGAAAAATLDLASRELRVSNMDVTLRGQALHLLAPAQFSFRSGLSVDALKVGGADAVLEVSGAFAPTLDLRASLVHVTATSVNAFAPGLLAGGTLDARAQVGGSWSSPTGHVSVDAAKLQFADDAATGLPPVDLHAGAELADAAAALDATLTAGSGSQIKASGRIPLDANGAFDLKIGGKMDVGLANPLLEARGLRAAGALSIDAAVTGSRDAPVVEGGMVLAAGSLRDYAHGVNLTDINAVIAGNQGGLEIKSWTAKAATGTLTVSGTFGVLQPDLPLNLKVTAKNAQPVASSIITANMDANLAITGTVLKRLDVSGTVHVNRATIGIPDSLPPEVAVLDVRRRGQATAPPPGRPLEIGIEVAIQAPQEILVQGRGLDAELGGEIKLSGTADDLQATGGFDLQRGSFSIAGNKLNFTQGRVGFDGAGLAKKIDPTLDFTAQTTVTDSTVTLRITGVADAPQFEFTSSPALPQDEIMARLLFGESAAQLSALQAAEIGAALANLSGVGSGESNPLTKLQKSLGLDRLTLGTNTTTTASGATENAGAVAAGRYVSKRIYIEGKQSTAGTSQVLVDVDLTKHLKLQTRLGNGTATAQGTTPENDPGSSVGLIYQFEY